MVLGNGPGIGLSIIEWCEDARVTLRVVPPLRGPYLVRVGIHDENERVLVLVKPRRGDVLRETWVDMREREKMAIYIQERPCERVSVAGNQRRRRWWILAKSCPQRC